MFLAAIFLAGAALSPLVYGFVDITAKAFPVWRVVADKPFPQYVARTILILALLGTWQMRHLLGKASMADLGLRWGPDWHSEIWRAFALALAVLALLWSVSLLAGHRHWREPFSAGKLANTLIISALGAAAVATIEEIVFRGGLFGALQSGQTWRLPLVLSSLIFAVVHFLQSPRVSEPVTWQSGFKILCAMFSGGTGVNRLLQFVNLTLCGVLLAWAYRRTGSLVLSIGLHAGWIFAVKVMNAVTVAGEDSPFWGTRRVIDGWAATLALLILGALVLRLLRFPRGKTLHVHNTAETQAMG